MAEKILHRGRRAFDDLRETPGVEQQNAGDAGSPIVLSCTLQNIENEIGEIE